MVKTIGAFWGLIEQAALFLCYSSFLSTAQSKKRILAANFFTWVTLTLFNQLAWFTIPGFLVSLVVNLALSFFLFKSKYIYHLFSIVASVLLICLVDTVTVYGSSALLGITVQELYDRKMFYLAIVTTGKFIELMMAWSVHRYWKLKYSLPIHGRWLALALFFPIASLCVLVVIYCGFRNSTDLSIGAFLFSVVLGIANIAIILLIGSIEKNTCNRQETALLNQQMALQTQNILALEESYRAQRKSAHEFNHQIQVIHELLGQEKYAALNDYLEQLSKTHSTRVLGVNSKNPIIDAVLNQKYQYAREHGIDFQIQVNNLSSVPLPYNSLVVLLSNLLDNALEACIRYKGNPEIQCTLLYKDSFYIAVENTSEPVTILDGKIETTKEPKEDHGYGLLNIQRILRDLGAEYTFNYLDGRFRFIAEITI